VCRDPAAPLPWCRAGADSRRAARPRTAPAPIPPPGPPRLPRAAAASRRRRREFHSFSSGNRYHLIRPPTIGDDDYARSGPPSSPCRHRARRRPRPRAARRRHRADAANAAAATPPTPMPAATPTSPTPAARRRRERRRRRRPPRRRRRRPSPPQRRLDLRDTITRDKENWPRSGPRTCRSSGKGFGKGSRAASRPTFVGVLA
jgi:hypothetical protein